MRWVGKGTRSAGLSPDCPKERASCAEAEATSRADSYWIPAAVENQWRLERVCWKE